MNASKTVLIVLLSLVLFSACSKSGTMPAGNTSGSPAEISQAKTIKSADVVRVAAAPIEIRAGGTGALNVHLAIQPGYHVNANPPSYPYLKATVLQIPAAEGLSAGEIAYPKAVERKFGFAEKPLAVYEGETDLKGVLKAEPSAAKGQRSLPAKLLVQACDEEVCYPPGTVDLTIPVTVK